VVPVSPRTEPPLVSSPPETVRSSAVAPPLFVLPPVEAPPEELPPEDPDELPPLEELPLLELLPEVEFDPLVDPEEELEEDFFDESELLELLLEEPEVGATSSSAGVVLVVGWIVEAGGASGLSRASRQVYAANATPAKSSAKPMIQSRNRQGERRSSSIGSSVSPPPKSKPAGGPGAIVVTAASSSGSARPAPTTSNGRV
jgi:hypothetical protein